MKPAASSQKQFESRAEHAAAKATRSARKSGGAPSLDGVEGAARAEGAMRNTRDPSAQPTSGKDRPYKPSAKAGGVQRVVPMMAAQNNVAGGKDPWGGVASTGGKGEGMTRGSESKNPGRPKPDEKVRQLQRKLYGAAKQQKERRFHALYDRIFRPDVPEEAWTRVKRNKGAVGVDGVTLEALEQYGVPKRLSLQAGPSTSAFNNI